MKEYLLVAAAFVLLFGNDVSAGILLDDWDSPITVEDKTFTAISHSLSTSVNAFIGIGLSGDPNTGPYSFNIGGLSSVTRGLNAVIEYSVEINDPGLLLNVVGLDVTHIQNNSTVTTDLFSDSGFTTLVGTLSSTNGVPAGDIILGSPFTIFYVRDTTVLNVSGAISGFSNTFTQQDTQIVPEPASLILASLGAFGVFGFSMRRRRIATLPL